MSVFTILIPVLAIASEGRYIYSILQGKTRPSFFGWLIFTIEMSVICASSYAIGARETIALVGTFAFLHLITTLLSLKYGYVHMSRFNLVCVSISVLGMILWVFASPWYALLLNILVEVLAFLVIVRQLYLYPDTEDLYAWSLGLLAYGLNLVMLEHWAPEEYLFSAVNVFFCGLIVLLILKNKKSISYP